MPNYYAHLQFGERVLARLPEGLQRRLEQDEEAFRVGQYGPDPLFFYHPLTRNHARMLGMEMHREPVRPVLERLRRAVETGQPYAAGYAAGFLCHFALDSRCHKYIELATADERVTHAGIEAEFDRLLMERSGLDPRRETPLPEISLPPAFYETVMTWAYPGVTEKQFQEGFRLFRKVSRVYTVLAGHPARRVVNGLARLVPPWSFFLHAILNKGTSPAYHACCRQMLKLFEQAQVTAVAQVTAFFEGIQRREPLGQWCDMDFYGKRCPGPQLSAMEHAG